MLGSLTHLSSTVTVAAEFLGEFFPVMFITIPTSGVFSVSIICGITKVVCTGGRVRLRRVKGQSELRLCFTTLPLRGMMTLDLASFLIWMALCSLISCGNLQDAFVMLEFISTLLLVKLVFLAFWL